MKLFSTWILLALTLIVLSQCQRSNTSPQTGTNDGLIAYYAFDGNLLDSSGNNHDGAPIGNLTFGPDHSGQTNAALVLGSGFDIATNDFFHFQTVGSFSISFWFTLNTSNASGRLISTECPEGNFRVAAYSGGIYAFQFGGYYVYDTVGLNQWNFMVYVFNNRQVSLYKNGVLNFKGYDNDTQPLDYCAPFTIGAKASPAYDLWQGSVEKLRIYDRALTLEDVSELYSH